MPIQQQHFSARMIMAVLAGLVVALWLQPAHAAPTVTVPVQPRTVTVPVLTLTLTPRETSINAGGTTQVDMVVANTGDGAANTVFLKVSVPVGMRAAPAAGNGNQWAIGTVQAGSKKTITAILTVDKNMKAGDGILTASVTADGVAAVSATSVLTIKQGQVKGATTDGTDTAMTELPKTGMQNTPLWIGGILLASGFAGFFLARRQKAYPV